jgi:predicted ribosome quality control (RQC) complex YloA/Tae2 family protein
VLSLREVERAADLLDRRVVGNRVQGIVQPDTHTLVLTLYGGRSSDSAGRWHLLFSCSPTTARVSSPARPPHAPAAPPRFAQYLRAHLANARAGGARIIDGDRQLALRLHTREGDFDLLLAIFGRRSNLYVLDAQGSIVTALRPLAETRGDLAPGDPWRSPAATAPRSGGDRFAEVPDEDFLEAIEATYSSVEREGSHAAQVQRLERVLRKEAKALDRKLSKLEVEIAEAQTATGLERQGELLKAGLDRVQRGAREVVVRDWDSGADVTIALDPALSPSENAARLFKRYKKAVRTLTKAGAQLEAVTVSRAEIAQLEAELGDLCEAAEADGDDALGAFAQRPPVHRLLAKYAPAPAAARPEAPREISLAGRKVPARLVPRRYRTESGLEVWVGRSDAGNDHLSVRLARGNDLFFHLDGAPGSHVVLRTEGRADPPSEAVLDACELAVHFSKQRNASRADVHVVPIKNVRKPKGAKPGLVVVHGGKSIHLRRSPARLERILAARIEG